MIPPASRFACLAALALALAACSGAPKPLPAGPAPEYEEPRGFDGGAPADAPPPPK